MHRQKSDFAACCCRTTTHWAPRYPSLLLFSYHITQPPLLDIPSISPLTRTPSQNPAYRSKQTHPPTIHPTHNYKCSKKPTLDTRSPSRSPSPPLKKTTLSSHHSRTPCSSQVRMYNIKPPAPYHSAPPAAPRNPPPQSSIDVPFPQLYSSSPSSSPYSSSSSSCCIPSPLPGHCALLLLLL